MFFRHASIILLLFSYQFSQAQLCQGSLGDPIVNINFGAGINPGPPLSAAATNYQYLGVDCPNDGQYAVRNRTDNCYQNWHTLTADHTGNPNGYFMLVNASFQPSAFYVDTVDLFCSNTLYEFAAWAMNVIRNPTCGGNPTILPNLTFRIERTDGTLLQDYNTGDIPIVPAPTWNQYGFFFTAPSGVNRVVLRIVNNAPGGCGNDLALDDITFRPCGPLVSSTVNGGSSFDYCQGPPVQLSLAASVSSGFNNPSLQWQSSTDNGASWVDIPTANSPSLVVDLGEDTPPGAYLYRMAVSQSENVNVVLCRVNSAVLTVNVYPRPVLSIASNSPVCENGTIEVEATGASNYLWSGPNSFANSSAAFSLADAQEEQSGKYYVLATSDKGCTHFDSTMVTVNPRPSVLLSPAVQTICEGDAVQFQASGGDIYSWQPAEGLTSTSLPDPVASPTDSTEYMVIASNAFGCRDSASGTINVLKLPFANAGPDREILEGRSTVLDGAVAGTQASFTWTPNIAIDDVNSLQPTVNPNLDTEYILTTTSNLGCGTMSDTVLVKVYKAIYVPTAFSPNNDGLNDHWRIPGLGMFREHEVLVYNRAGQLVFSTRSNESWDGRYKNQPQPPGVFVYLVKIKEEDLLLKGWLMLVR